jgi:hypothetical protein
MINDSSPTPAVRSRSAAVCAFVLSFVLISSIVGSAFAKEEKSAEVSLIDPLMPGISLKFSVPVQFLAPRIADDVRNGATETDNLYLILKYMPTSGDPVLPASPRDLGQGTPNVVHTFVNLIRTLAQRDSGKWYLDRALRDQLLWGKRVEPLRLNDSGLLKYELGKLLNEEGYSYVDSSSKTIFVHCYLRICRGYRTWRDVVTVDYHYGKELVGNIRENDLAIDRFLSNTYVANR